MTASFHNFKPRLVVTAAQLAAAVTPALTVMVVPAVVMIAAIGLCADRCTGDAAHNCAGRRTATATDRTANYGTGAGTDNRAAEGIILRAGAGRRCSKRNQRRKGEKGVPHGILRSGFAL